MVAVRIISSLDQTAAALERYVAGVPHMLDLATEAAAKAAVAVMTPAVRDETPVLSGDLQQSTQGDVISMPGQAQAQITQDAESDRGDYYGQYVIHGHRIVAWGHDTGRMQPPDDYPQRAYDHVLPVLEEETAAAVEAVVRVMRIAR